MIDIVITWVDDRDINWQNERNSYLNNNKVDNSSARYRDWGLLKYLFRGIEENMPWVNKIHFVTYGHLPKWLNGKHPKLNIVKHIDFIPKEYLPTFNINPIELNFHRIEGLSEHFIYFNDDMFPISKLYEADFFVKGLPCDCPIETAISGNNYFNPFATILLNTTTLFNANFNKKEVIKKYKKKWFSFKNNNKKDLLRKYMMLPYGNFCGFKYDHLPSPINKSIMEEVWEKNGEILNEVCKNKFRSSFDINQYIFKYWTYGKGEFHPTKFRHNCFFSIDNDIEEIIKTISNKSKKMICINDSEEAEFENNKKLLIDAFNMILPKKSLFEK